MNGSASVKFRLPLSVFLLSFFLARYLCSLCLLRGLIRLSNSLQNLIAYFERGKLNKSQYREELKWANQILL